MGKSDNIITQRYLEFLGKHLPKKIFGRAAFLGFSKETAFLEMLNNDGSREFLDITLPDGTDIYRRWDINGEWSIKEPEKYGLIVCTRCPYFAKYPEEFVQKCLASVKPGGYVFIDWGLGDHWRFPKFKVGWYEGKWHGEGHEFSEVPGAGKQYLHSTMWDRKWDFTEGAQEFRKNIRDFGYNDNRCLTDIINDEVPCVLRASRFSDSIVDVETVCLWPESPQLYTMVLLQRKL